MYFPFIRGKQYDLLAIRDLCPLFSLNGNKNLISPIIEPVNLSSTFDSTILGLAASDVNFSIIINPKVGKPRVKPQDIIARIKEKLTGFTNYQIGYIIENEGGLEILNLLEDLDYNGFTLIHKTVLSNMDYLNAFSEMNSIRYNVVDLIKTGMRYSRNFERDSVVSLSDIFPSQKRNVDYSESDNNFLTEEHLFYSEEGLAGFSDYLTIGEPYSDGGFLPYAVAIHISYPETDNKIWVKHFVSNSNEDYEDTAGKYQEAMEKLIPWIDEKGLRTKALDQLREFYQRNHFPGLGSLKKMSIMNHIELVLDLIK